MHPLITDEDLAQSSLSRVLRRFVAGKQSHDNDVLTAITVSALARSLELDSSSQGTTGLKCCSEDATLA